MKHNFWFDIGDTISLMKCSFINHSDPVNYYSRMDLQCTKLRPSIAILGRTSTKNACVCWTNKLRRLFRVHLPQSAHFIPKILLNVVMSKFVRRDPSQSCISHFTDGNEALVHSPTTKYQLLFSRWCLLVRLFMEWVQLKAWNTVHVTLNNNDSIDSFYLQQVYFNIDLSINDIYT